MLRWHVQVGPAAPQGRGEGDPDPVHQGGLGGDAPVGAEVITPVVHVIDFDCTSVGSSPGDAMFFICPALVNLMRLVFHAQTSPA